MGNQLELFHVLAVEDLEKNDGSAEKPYYMSAELREILGKKNKASPKRSPAKDATDGGEVELEKLNEAKA